MIHFMILKRDILTREITVDHQGLSQLRIMRQRTWGSYMFDELTSRIGICNLYRAMLRLRDGCLMHRVLQCRLPSRGDLAALFTLRDCGISS